MKPKFKETIPVFCWGNEIQIGEEDGVAGIIPDPSGSITLLVQSMNGKHTLDDLVQIVQKQFPEIPREDILTSIQALNQEGYIEDASIEPSQLKDYDRERYKANINFFSLFTSLEESKYAIQEKINNCKISLLGVGGLGSQILYHLAALGFHNIRALDFDRLELSNFNRQLLYSESDVGQLKTEMALKRINQFNPNVNLSITNCKIGKPEDVYQHIEGTEYVVCVADKPTLYIQNWVNEAVVKAGLPMVSGGVLNTRGRFYSMIPGETGCVQCHVDSKKHSDHQFERQLNFMEGMDFQRNNAAISPNVAILAGAMVNELLKLVTGFPKPIALGKMMEINFFTLDTKEISRWEKNSTCPICHSTRSNRAKTTSTEATPL
ncbi:HesA/MoeB/ThiF family protein [Marininema halotolerans]|uniref:Molybdopterin or thiamine biosynthesis adenylyltransferase n=1 Tax=Marininema halotolerans TaxID=1155944 RepID=A0A1I6Q2U1_9BACL|nr:ThiF family adenylyltransferase [Marininema halotolerans]SFS46811.1 Molybdopterin or thiamine biosynthesis adenylyltransferase [Marininema halotolerans]